MSNDIFRFFPVCRKDFGRRPKGAVKNAVIVSQRVLQPPIILRYISVKRIFCSSDSGYFLSFAVSPDAPSYSYTYLVSLWDSRAT